MNTDFLEKYFETAILSLYKDDVNLSTITWKDHGKVGLDTWAHYFEDENGREFVLLNEDFPGNEYLSDNITHELVPLGPDTSARVIIHPETSIENVTGYFTLYAEKR